MYLVELLFQIVNLFFNLVNTLLQKDFKLLNYFSFTLKNN